NVPLHVQASCCDWRFPCRSRFARTVVPHIHATPHQPLHQPRSHRRRRSPCPTVLAGRKPDSTSPGGSFSALPLFGALQRGLPAFSQRLGVRPCHLWREATLYAPLSSNLLRTSPKTNCQTGEVSRT